MSERHNPSNPPEPRPLDPRLKRQIAIVFLISVIFSSLLIYFSVVERTELYLEQEREAAEAQRLQEEESQP